MYVRMYELSNMRYRYQYQYHDNTGVITITTIIVTTTVTHYSHSNKVYCCMDWCHTCTMYCNLLHDTLVVQ